jgi:hypothetical protein
LERRDLVGRDAPFFVDLAEMRRALVDLLDVLLATFFAPVISLLEDLWTG